jgi:hypothetical protein
MMVDCMRCMVFDELNLSSLLLVIVVKRQASSLKVVKSNLIFATKKLQGHAISVALRIIASARSHHAESE